MGGLLGDRVKGLSETNDVLLLLYRVNARLDGFSVLGTGTVEDLGDFLLWSMLRRRQRWRVSDGSLLASVAEVPMQHDEVAIAASLVQVPIVEC